MILNMKVSICLLVLQSVSAFPPLRSSHCCDEKEVGNVTYILVDNDGEEITKAYDCMDGCIYTPKDNNERKFCFKSGNLPVSCHDDHDHEGFDPALCSSHDCPGGSCTPGYCCGHRFCAPCCEECGTPCVPGIQGNGSIRGALAQCEIESLTFGLDVSESMTPTELWRPLALDLVSALAKRLINNYYVFSYVDNQEAITTTQDNETFIDILNDWDKTTYNFNFGNSLNTFAALKHALEVSNHAIIIIWTDQIGNDTDNQEMREEILDLKKETKSEIFFMHVHDYVADPHPYPDGWTGEPDHDHDHDHDHRSKRDNDDGGNRAIVPEFLNKFKDIGLVFDIEKEDDVIDKIISIMKKSSVCGGRDERHPYVIGR